MLPALRCALRVGDLGEKNHGATASPTMLDAKLSARLTAMPGLPESVTAVLRQRGSGKGLFDRSWAATSRPTTTNTVRGRLMAALQAADQPVDGGEPSWPALGHLIGEVSFLQAWRQVAFLRSVNASAGDSVTQLMPLVAKHCCRSLIESRRDDPSAEASPATIGEDPPLRRRARSAGSARAPGNRGIDPACWNRQSPWLTLVMDDVANDLVITSKGVPDWHVSAARRLLEVSPDSPYAKAVLVESDWPSVRKQAAAWEKDAGNQPALLVALAGTIHRRGLRRCPCGCAGGGDGFRPRKRRVTCCQDLSATWGEGEVAGPWKTSSKRLTAA